MLHFGKKSLTIIKELVEKELEICGGELEQGAYIRDLEVILDPINEELQAQAPTERPKTILASVERI